MATKSESVPRRFPEKGSLRLIFYAEYAIFIVEKSGKEFLYDTV